MVTALQELIDKANIDSPTSHIALVDFDINRAGYETEDPEGEKDGEDDD
jgi:hypothetical protein